MVEEGTEKNGVRAERMKVMRGWFQPFGHNICANHRETSRDALLEIIVSTENLSVCLRL